MSAARFSVSRGRSVHRSSRLRARLRHAVEPGSDPTGLRRGPAREAKVAREPAVTLDPERSARIDAELAGKRKEFQRLLVEEYRDSLYW